MKHLFPKRLLACLATLLFMWPALAPAAPFTPGNVVVVRVGDGSAALTSAATATFLVEYTPAGVLVQTIALPTAAAGTNSILTNTGTSTSDAMLTRSANGAYLVLTGYDAALGTAALTTTASTANNRVIGRVAADGSVDTSTRISDAFSGTTASAANIRSAASTDGTAFYAGGSNSGVRYVPFGNAAATATVQVNTAPTNIRYVGVAGGNLYVSSGSSTTLGVSQIGTGLPTTTGQANSLLTGTSSVSPYSFYFADLSTTVAGVDVLYVADDNSGAGAIQKYSLVGSTWTLNGTVGPASAAVRGLAGSVSGTTVSLFATSINSLYAVTDNAGYNAAPSTTTLPAAIATSATNTAFRGAAFAPVSAVVAPAPTITSFTPTSGAAGATVTITGTDFTGATAVTLNGAAITGFTVVNATTITFVVPASAASGTIAVTTPGGTATSTGTFTFVPAASAPTIASFTPTSGPVGTSVTVTGTNFTGATTVTLNGVAITGFTVVNATTITFAVPTGATSGTIAVTTAGGTATSTGTFTVSAPVVVPVLTSITPNAQVVGGPAVTLNIVGTGFTPASTVNFNGVSYAQTSSTATTLVVTIPASAVATVGNYSVTVTNTAGTSNINTFTVSNPSTAGAFEDFETGVKTSYAAAAITLASGSWTFSDALIGTTFSDRFNGLKSARIRAGFIRMDFDKTTGAGTVTVNAALYGIDTGATFLLEKSTDGGVTFTTVPGGPATLTNTLTPYTFTVNQAGNVRFRITNTLATTVRISIDDISITNYTTPAPTITSFSPASGLPGTVVTVTGTNFTGATALTLNGGAVASFTVVSATQITFTVPVAATSGTIAVTTPGGMATSATAFTVLLPNPVPVITSITPNTASVGAATSVTITGTGFTAASVVNADGNPIASTFVSATQITGAVPAGAPAGVYSITVVNPTPGGGTSNAVTFTLTNPVPTITSFTPTSGGPGATVTITGTNLLGATAVRIGTYAVTNFTVVSPTSITFVVPGGSGSISGTISVVTPGGTATSATPFNLVSATLATQALPGLSVFPNPATDRLTVALPKAAAATVALRDLTGRLVLAPATLGADQLLLLPASLAAGVYLLEVRQGEVTAVRRVQKN